jgi:hypothetical protein
MGCICVEMIARIVKCARCWWVKMREICEVVIV